VSRTSPRRRSNSQQIDLTRELDLTAARRRRSLEEKRASSRLLSEEKKSDLVEGEDSQNSRRLR